MAKECIEREALRKAMEHVYRDSTCPMHIAAEVDQYITEAPAADVVEVVRCRDCKHWRKGNSMGGDDLDHLEYIGSCSFVRFARCESNYCEKGERRDKNEP